MKTLITVLLIFCLSIPALAQVQLYSRDGTYLGNLTNNPYDRNSINNPYGRYGSPYSRDSIHNPYGKYGSPYSSQSPDYYGGTTDLYAPPCEPKRQVIVPPTSPPLDVVDSVGRGFELGRRIGGGR